MNGSLILSLILWVMSATTLWAQQTQPVKVDLASSADLAIQRNLTIRASQQDITTATTVVNQVRGLGHGRVDAVASYYRLNDPITLNDQTITVGGTTVVIPGQTVADQNVTFANVSGSYPLFDSGRIRSGTRSAEDRVAEARNVSGDTQLNVVLQTTRTYLAAIYGRENVRVNEASLKSYEEHLSQAQKSLKEGVATRYDVTRAEAAVEDQRKRLANVRNQYELALANLRTVLLLPKDACIDLQGGFFQVPAQPPVSDAEEIAVKADPLLRSIADRSCSLLWAEKSVRAEQRPQLDAVGFLNLLPRDQGFLTNAQWFVGVQLSQVVFDGGVVRSRAAQRRSEREKNDTELASTANDIRLSVRSAYLDMNTACSAIAAAQKSVELAREALRLAERRFAEGVGTSLEVLDANINLLAAETGLQQSLYQLDSAYLTAHRYIGDLVQVTRCAQAAEGTNLEGRTQ